MGNGCGFGSKENAIVDLQKKEKSGGFGEQYLEGLGSTGKIPIPRCFGMSLLKLEGLVKTRKIDSQTLKPDYQYFSGMQTRKRWC